MSTRCPSRVAPLTRPSGTAATVTTRLCGEAVITVTLPCGSRGWLAPFRLSV